MSITRITRALTAHVTSRLDNLWHGASAFATGAYQFTKTTFNNINILHAAIVKEIELYQRSDSKHSFNNQRNILPETKKGFRRGFLIGGAMGLTLGVMASCPATMIATYVIIETYSGLQKDLQNEKKWGIQYSLEKSLPAHMWGYLKDAGNAWLAAPRSIIQYPSTLLPRKYDNGSVIFHTPWTCAIGMFSSLCASAIYECSDDFDYASDHYAVISIAVGQLATLLHLMNYSLADINEAAEKNRESKVPTFPSRCRDALFAAPRAALDFTQRTTEEIFDIPDKAERFLHRIPAALHKEGSYTALLAYALWGFAAGEIAVGLSLFASKPESFELRLFTGIIAGMSFGMIKGVNDIVANKNLYKKLQEGRESEAISPTLNR